MSEENKNVKAAPEVQEPAVVPEDAAEKAAPVAASEGTAPAEGVSSAATDEEKLKNAPVPTNLGVAVITAIYILFVLAVGIGLIALSIFLFRKLGSWLF